MLQTYPLFNSLSRNSRSGIIPDPNLRKGRAHNFHKIRYIYIHAYGLSHVAQLMIHKQSEVALLLPTFS